MTVVKQKWNLHFCPFDKKCRQIGGRGAPVRLHMNAPWFHFAVAFTRGSRFARVNKKSKWISFGRFGRYSS